MILHYYTVFFSFLRSAEEMTGTLLEEYLLLSGDSLFGSFLAHTTA